MDSENKWFESYITSSYTLFTLSFFTFVGVCEFIMIREWVTIPISQTWEVLSTTLTWGFRHHNPPRRLPPANPVPPKQEFSPSCDDVFPEHPHPNESEWADDTVLCCGNGDLLPREFRGRTFVSARDGTVVDLELGGRRCQYSLFKTRNIQWVSI